jgi:hypothetical protein
LKKEKENRYTDVAVDDLLEGEGVALGGIGQDALVLVGLHHQLAAHGVRRPDHRLRCGRETTDVSFLFTTNVGDVKDPTSI